MSAGVVRQQEHPPSLAPARRGLTLPAEEGEPTAPPLWLRLDDRRCLAIDRRLIIGSAPDGDLVLDDPRVSGRHCVVFREGGRTVVSDCGSRNGTFVDGTRVVSAELRPGARITVGRTRLRVAAEASEEGDRFEGLLGGSPPMRALRRQIERLAGSRSAVLLLGESGTGKELAARAVHVRSRRRGAFVAVNCGAIASELAESELFGHERGAFTGAAARHPGFFEEADGGTLFLDEIAELPIGLQPKLLRALEAGTVRAVGASMERRVEVRVVAATHQDLRSAVAAGRFRLDLYHRLSTLEIALPPLRERSEDIPLLARHFLDEIAAETGVRRLSPTALAALAGRDWPGNLRELRNTLLRAAVLGGETIEPDDLLPSFRPEPTRYPMPAGHAPLDIRRLDEVERELIEQALRASGGNRRAAAGALGMPKSTLCDKVRRYGLRP